MKSFFPILFFLCFFFQLNSQNIIEGCKTGQPLVEAVRALYTPDLTLGYGPARDTLYSQIDNNGLELSGIYTDFTVTLDPNQDPSISAFQNEKGINAEHSYPQSKGARDEPGRSDMHHLFPSKVSVNSARGSCPFGEIEDNDTEYWFYLGDRESQIPAMDKDNYSEKDEESCVFEPRESVKGDIARAVFYFYTIYQRKADNADANFFPRQKEVLLTWHKTDPVSEKETRRNALIASYQGNSNPFILDKTLAERAFFTEDAEYEEGSVECVTDVTVSTVVIEKENWIQLLMNPVREEILIQSTRNNGQLFLYNLNGQIVKRKVLNYDNEIAVNDLPQGYYFLVGQSEGVKKIFKVLIF